MEPTIALVFSPELWVERLHRHLVDHGGARVRQIVLEPSLALEDEYDTLVVSHRWPGLTRLLVDEVHRRGRNVLGVFDPDEPAGREHLLALGADDALASDAAVADFVSRIAALAPTGTHPAGARSWAPDARDYTHDDAREPQPGPVVVAGPPGVGVSEVALGLATALAVRGETTVLVDADEVSSSTAARLGLPLEPNLRTAVDAVVHGRGEPGRALVTVGRPPFHVVCGLPKPAAASHVSPRDVTAVVAALGRTHAQTIVEVSGWPSAEIAPIVLRHAAAVVGVGAASPVGVTRLVGWFASMSPATRVHVVLNRAPAGRYQQAELTAEVYRALEPASLSFVPHDRRVERAAWAGETVARGAFCAAVAEAARAAVPRAARAARAARATRAGRATRRSRRATRAA